MEAPSAARADAYLGLGSNVGHRPRQLRTALRELRDAGVRLVGISSLYLTEPVEVDEHPWYVNCVAAVDDPPEPAELLELCMEVERRGGRDRRTDDGRSGPGARARPRPVDLDLLLYGRQVRHEGRLTLPHPRLHERRFVLRPLVELDPEAWHPERRATARQMLEGLPRGDGVWLLAPPPRMDDR